MLKYTIAFALIYMTIGLLLYAYSCSQGDKPNLGKMLFAWPLALLGNGWLYK